MRSAVGLAQQGAQQAGQVGQQLQGQAGQTLQGVMDPLSGIERSGMTPQEMSNMLVAGQQETGGALSGVQGQANLQAARSRNVGGYGMALDEAARQKMRQDTQTALNIQNMALQRQMQGLGLGADIYGRQLGASMQAMGLIPQNVEAMARANQTGWVQNLFGQQGIIPALTGQG